MMKASIKRQETNPDGATVRELGGSGIITNLRAAGKQSWLNPNRTRCVLSEAERSKTKLLNSYKGLIQ